MTIIETTAYTDGHRAGRLDRFIGIRSEYAWHSINDMNIYAARFGQGYHDGWNGYPLDPSLSTPSR